MPVHSYLVIFAFLVLFGVFLVQYIRVGRPGVNLVGDPPIERRYFYAGKLALLATWSFFLLKAVRPEIGYLFLPDFFSWMAFGWLAAGVAIVSVALCSLGSSLRLGLPSGEINLQRRGLYRISRNPIYVGVMIISMASCLYFPDLINIAFTLFTIYIHHLIIGQEERFLAKRFGTDWIVYSARVSRYI